MDRAKYLVGDAELLQHNEPDQSDERVQRSGSDAQSRQCSQRNKQYAGGSSIACTLRSSQKVSRSFAFITHTHSSTINNYSDEPSAFTPNPIRPASVATRRRASPDEGTTPTKCAKTEDDNGEVGQTQRWHKMTNR